MMIEHSFEVVTLSSPTILLQVRFYDDRTCYLLPTYHQLLQEDFFGMIEHPPTLVTFSSPTINCNS